MLSIQSNVTNTIQAFPLFHGPFVSIGGTPHGPSHPTALNVTDYDDHKDTEYAFRSRVLIPINKELDALCANIHKLQFWMASWIIIVFPFSWMEGKVIIICDRGIGLRVWL